MRGAAVDSSVIIMRRKSSTAISKGVDYISSAVRLSLMELGWLSTIADVPWLGGGEVVV